MSVQERYRELRQQGLSHEEAIDRINSLFAGSRSRSEDGALSSIGEFSQGLALGGTRALTSLGEGFGQILDIVGADVIGEGLKDVSRDVESEAEEFFTPEGTAGAAGELVGRIGGEAATTLGTLGLSRAASLRYAPQALKTLQDMTRGSRVRSAIAASVLESPLSLARASSYAERQGTDFGRELGIELLGSAFGGAFSSTAKAARPQVSDSLFGSVRLGTYEEAGTRPGRLLNPRERAAAQIFDQYLPIRKFARAATPGDISAERRISGLISQMLGSTQAGYEYLKRGGPALKLSQAFAPWLRANRNNLQAINKAALIRREMVLRANGLGSRMANIGNKELQEMHRTVLNNPELKKATDELQEFFRENLRLQRDEGIVRLDEYDAIVKSSIADGVDDYYTPMIRARSREDVTSPAFVRRTGSAFQTRSTVRPIDQDVVSRDPLVSPVDILPIETMRVFDNVATKRVGDGIATLIEQTPNKELDGIIRLATRDDLSEASGRIWRHKSYNKEFENLVDEDGFINYVVEDPDLFEALTRQSPEAAGIMTDILKKVANLKRQSITLLPDFAVLSVLRDLPLYAVQRAVQRGPEAVGESLVGGTTGFAVGLSGEGTEEEKLTRALQLGAAGLGVGVLARPTVEVARAGKAIAGARLANRDINTLANTSRTSSEILSGLGRSLGIDPGEWNEFVRQGGLTVGLSYGKKDAEKLVAGLMNKDERNTLRSTLGGVKEALETIGMVAENAPRLAMYRAMRSGAASKLPGSSVQEAIWSAQDVTLPFALRGSNKTVQTIAQITPFFNATLQGYSKLFRLFRGDPSEPALKGASQSMLAMGTAMTAPTVALWSVNKDNPEYWDRPLWERNLFWLIPKPEGGFFRVPKPFELGYAFASLPERALDAWAQSGKIESAVPPGTDAASEITKSLVDFAKNPLTGTLPIPAALQPLMEQAVNRDLFRWKPIVPEYLGVRPSARQTTPTTPVLANKIGELTNISPLRVEALIQSLGGTVGRRAMQLVDIAGTATDSPTPASKLTPAERLAQVTGATRFNTQQYDIGNIEYSAWNILNNAKTVEDEYNRMVRSGVAAQALENYKEQYEDELNIAKASKGLLREMRNIRQRRNSLLRNQNIPERRLQTQLNLASTQGRKAGERAFKLIDRVAR
jgi:hypothetical protein